MDHYNNYILKNCLKPAQISHGNLSENYLNFYSFNLREVLTGTWKFEGEELLKCVILVAMEFSPHNSI